MMLVSSAIRDLSEEMLGSIRADFGRIALSISSFLDSSI